MNARKYHLIHIFSLVLLTLFFLASLVASQILFRNARIDLTERKLWTLSPQSIEILNKVEQSIDIKLFFSNKLTQQSPAVHRFSQRVRSLLREIEQHTSRKIKIEYIDPAPFSEEEDRALSYGLRALAVIEDVPLYFGMAATNRSDSIEVMPIFSIERQHQLEYDLIHLIHRLARKRKPRLGVITSLPLDTGIEGLPAALEGRAQPFLIYQQLFDNYKLEFLEQNLNAVPRGIKTLFIAHPKKLSQATLYALDQFVLRGGRALILLDPLCEISQLTNKKGKRLRGLALQSDLAPLLKQWGVTYDKRDVVADRVLAQNVIQRDSLRRSNVERKYVLWLNASQDNIAQDNIITKGLSSISLATSGFFTPLPTMTASFQPLITSSKDAMVLSTKYLTKKSRTPDDLLSNFFASNREYVLAARLQGNFKSAFSKRPKAKKKRRKSPPYPYKHLKKSSAPADIVLLADSDLLEKRFWIDLPTYYQQGVVVPVSDNDTFIINALDALTDNEGLIQLRTRKPQTRSFVQVDELRAQASQRLTAEEFRLRQNIDSIEARLAQFGKNPSRSAGGRAELTKLERELLASRRALHKVRLELNRAIENLGLWIKLFAILFVPLVLVMMIFIHPWLKKRMELEKHNV